MPTPAPRGRLSPGSRGEVSPNSSHAGSGSWFPPATFQLRIRSLKSILFTVSNKPRRGYLKGKFFISLHRDPEWGPFWVGKALPWSADRQEKLLWTDIDLEKAAVHPASPSAVVKVWFLAPDGTKFEDLVAGVHFSGLQCLGTNLPPHRRLAPDSLVYGLGAASFGSPDSGPVRRHIFIPVSGSREEVGKTYTTGLLLRLHRMQRALHRQEASNDRIKRELEERGVLGPEVIEEKLTSCPEQETKGEPRSLRDQVFQTKRPKSSRVRMTETRLKLRIEDLSVKVGLLRKELENRKESSKRIKDERVGVSCENSAKSEELQEDLAVVSREQVKFKGWKANFRTKLINGGLWSRALKESRLDLIRSFLKIYPISDTGGRTPSIRWVRLPDPRATNLKEYSAKNDVAVTVATGWLAHLLHLTSSVLDAPLRYPLRLVGSNSHVQDRTRTYPQDSSDFGEFPLFVKGNGDWNRYEYGIYLLAKNVAQIRLMLGLSTKDLRRILSNLHEVMTLGKSDKEMGRIVKVLPELLPLTDPPPTLEIRHQERRDPEDPSISSSTSSSSEAASSDCEIGIEAKEDHLFLESSPLPDVPVEEPEAAPGSQSDERCEAALENVQDIPVDTFWRDAENQSMALLSNPSNFRRSRVGSGSKGFNSNRNNRKF